MHDSLTPPALDAHAAPGAFLARVVRRRSPCTDHFWLTLAVERFPHAVPGQFLQLRCRDPEDLPLAARPGGALPASITKCARAVGQATPLLRRPFSIAGLRRAADTCELDILGRAVGPATAWLAALNVGDSIDLLGPLGRGFCFPPPAHRSLLVAGGVGLPPILWLGEELAKTGVHCDAICGARTRDILPLTLLGEPSLTCPTPCAEEFSRWGIKTMITTDDGSHGVKGTTIEGLKRYFAAHVADANLVVYACGPTRMLRAVASFCADRSISCQVAMERTMGCGMGTCQSCVVPIRDSVAQSGWRYALCCSDGPVFDAANVLWADIKR